MSQPERDLEHIVAIIPRRDGGELRVMRRTYNGSRPFTQLTRFFVDSATGELRPTRQTITLKDEVLPPVIAALTRIAAKVSRTSPDEHDERPQEHRQRPAQQQPLPLGEQQPPRRFSDDELAELDRIF